MIFQKITIPSNTIFWYFFQNTAFSKNYDFQNYLLFFQKYYSFQNSIFSKCSLVFNSFFQNIIFKILFLFLKSNFFKKVSFKIFYNFSRILLFSKTLLFSKYSFFPKKKVRLSKLSTVFLKILLFSEKHFFSK